jgi:Ca2+-binding EF-hand superfamily protein
MGHCVPKLRSHINAKRQEEEEKELRRMLDEAFEYFDRDGNNILDFEEVKRIVKFSYDNVGGKTPGASVEEAAMEFMREVDQNQDGKIDREEFMRFYKEH